MARALTENERCVLSHVVVDPDAWWEHATNWPKIDEETDVLQDEKSPKE